MTEYELRDDIIIKMLDYKDKPNFRIMDFCVENKIYFDTQQQRKRIFESLNNSGYINAQFYRDGDGDFTITSKGVKYAEDILKKGRIELQTDEIKKNLESYLDENGATDEIYNKQKNKSENINNTGENSSAREISKLYISKENNKEVKDNSVEACFGVETLAECYTKLIDRACDYKEHNVCMFGIFAPWGRGKTYFFKKVKEYIDRRKSSKAMQYDIVEFNAWKYQETPAVWAYLFETLYNSKNWWFKFFYTIKRNIKSIGCDVLIYFIPTILTAIATLITKCEPNKDNMFIGTSIVGVISIIGLIINFISKHYNSAISLIKKYTKGISFAKELGMQAEVEKEITSLLKFWISDKEAIKKKVILYVDDIDRCSETKMTSIIDSLRTVLENDEIRKRLIIICSIDPEKIIKGIEYKYQTLYDEKERRSIAIEQMDKIFLTGIALAPLNNEELFEFAAKLAEVEDNRNSNNLTASKKSLDDIIRESIMEETRRDLLYVKLDDEQIYLELKNFIKDYTKQLTPRKIRIIYYRIVLANNIICNKKDSMITKTLINNIFNLSVGNKIEKSDKDDELTDILNMVVPYRYNEEDEVTSKVTQG